MSLVSYTRDVIFTVPDSSQLWKWSVWSRFHLCWGKRNSGGLPANGGNTKMLPATGSAAEWSRPAGI